MGRMVFSGGKMTGGREGRESAAEAAGMAEVIGLSGLRGYFDDGGMKFGYTILYVPEVARAVGFYESAFGFERRFVHEGGDYAELETGGTALAFASLELARANLPGGVRPADLGEPPAAVELGFTTEDVAGAFARATVAGAVPVSAPVAKPWGQVVAYVRDPDGHLIELCTPMG